MEIFQFVSKKHGKSLGQSNLWKKLKTYYTLECEEYVSVIFLIIK